MCKMYPGSRPYLGILSNVRHTHRRAKSMKKKAKKPKNMSKETEMFRVMFGVDWEIDNRNIREMELTSPGCPVQFEGKLKDGNHFYFRERHDWTRFTIAPTLPKAVRGEETLYDVSQPGSFLPNSAAPQISKWVDDYFKRQKELSRLMGKKYTGRVP